MFICFVSNSHGQIQSLFQRIAKHSEVKGVIPDWVVHIGSLGVWPDPKRTDRATRQFNTKIRVQTDFHKFYLNSTPLPYKTLFLPGKHEDHRWIRSMYNRKELELIPNLFHLVSGYARYIHTGEESIKVLGLGKVFSPSTYFGQENKKSHSHYTKAEVERACSQGPVDLFLSTEAGYGCLTSKSLGINNILSAVHPQLAVHAHRSFSMSYINALTKTNTLSIKSEEVKFFEYSQKTFTKL